MHVLLAAGGTGGHIEPALNVGDALRRLDPTVAITVLGSDRGLETTLVPARGYDLVTVPSVPDAATSRRRPGQAGSAAAARRSGARRRSCGSATADVVIGLRRLRRGAGLPGGPPHPHPAHHPRGQCPSRAWPTGSGPGSPRTSTRPSRARCPAPSRWRCRCGTRSRPSTGPRPAQRGARRTSASSPDAPVLLVFGGSQGAMRLNSVVAGALPVAAGRGHRGPARLRQSQRATRPGRTGYVAGALHRAHGPGVRRGRPRPHAGRSHDLRRAGRGRAARRLRAPAHRERRAARATRCPSWRPAVAC